MSAEGENALRIEPAEVRKGTPVRLSATGIPLERAAVEWLVNGETELASGITVVPTPGHVPHHQSVRIENEGDVAFYLGDLVPTVSHLPLPWIMGYDVEPLVTLESKRTLLTKAVADNWLLVFEHDASVAWGRVRHDGKAYAFSREE